MNMRFMLSVFFCGMFILSCNHEVPSISPSIIPEPVDVKLLPGKFRIDKETVLLTDTVTLETMQIADLIKDIIEQETGIALKIVSLDANQHNENCISVNPDPEIDFHGQEGYHLIIEPERIRISASHGAGLFYGVQTLIQLFPVQDSGIHGNNIELPCVSVIDYPRFPYRGMHLDVSRHFFPVDFIKKYIDLMARHKMNRFHWHLTDDNGWRIEIKKYPKLQEISAWRVDRENMPWGEVTPPRPGEKATYGGYYTQEEIREIIAYAAERHVTIIPEIEMPGHSCEVLAAYPELSCTGGPFYVQPGTYWPNIDIFCAGKEATFEFLEGVLDEVIELFPSEYIHIGGDEANKTNWETCPDCQHRINEEGLESTHELQSYFIKRIERYLNSKGRQIIGWDEILEGGLAPGATVMSWRGMDGGITAAQQGHDVIMTPTSHCYFDYYQADPEFQPEAIGGYTTLKKVYSFEPLPPELNDEESGHILGAQGNLWTEFIKTPSQAEYMAVPRMSALAEVCWSPKEKKNWGRFLQSLQKHFLRLENLNVNYCKGSFGVDIDIYTSDDGLVYAKLLSESWKPAIYYTLDGRIPDINSGLYKGPVRLDTSSIITAVVFHDNKMMEKPSVADFVFHKGVRGLVVYITSYHHRYPAKGTNSLINGLKGNLDHHNDQWQGFYGKDLDVVLDLGEVRRVDKVSATFLHQPASYIFMPVSVHYSYSNDGREYKPLIKVSFPDKLASRKGLIQEFSQEMDGIKTRYIRMVAHAGKVCPEWHPAKGEKSWIFADEIVVK